MTRKEELDWLCRLRSEIYVYMPKEWLIPMNNALDMAIKALEQRTCVTMKDLSDEDLERFVEEMKKVRPQVIEQEPCDFARWVAREIFDDQWEYNKDSFAEIACRKLAKLGIIRAKGDEWVLVEPEREET